MTDQNEPIPHSALLPLLPIVYVAWADGELSADEIHRLRDLSGEWIDEDQLEAAARDTLHRWLDPARPPSARELQDLRRTIRRAADQLPESAADSLVELGLELRRLRSSEPPDPALEATTGALRQMEELLGVVPSEASRELLASERPAPAVVVEGPPLPVEPMAALLDGERRDLRQRLRRLLAGKAFHRPLGLPKESYRERVRDWLGILAEGGFGALSYPPEDGGEGDMEAFMVAFETLATHDLSLTVKFGVQFGLWGGSLLFLGSEEQQRRYLGATGRGELLGCFAMTETGHGSNVQELETTARFDPEEGDFVLRTPTASARKDYIGNAAAHGTVATVFAQLEVGDHHHGVHALVVPIRDGNGDPLPGVTIEDCGLKLGLNGVDNGRLSFDRVRVPRQNLLGRFAEVDEKGTYSSPIASPNKRFFTMLGTLVGGRVSVAAAAVSAAKAGLTTAVRYGDRRRQFGPAGACETRLLDYPSHQRRLLPRLAATYAYHFAVEETRRRFLERSEEDQIEVEHLAAGIKALATWHAAETLQGCRECCGGAGYLAENRFAELKADSDVFTTFEGDNTVLLQLVAKGLLTGFRQQFAEARFKGLLRYVARSAVVAVTEMNPIVTRSTDREHLLDPDFHTAALEYRERRLLGTAAQRLRGRLESGMDGFQALLECQNHLLVLARAHVEKVVFDIFANAVENAGDGELRPLLAKLHQLFTLSLLEEDRGWFLEQGYFEGAKAKAIRDLVDELCAELRPYAAGLVDSFGIPDELLAAPLGTDDPG